MSVDSTSGVGLTNVQWLSQGFTPGTSGTLTGADVIIFFSSGAIGPLTVRIRNSTGGANGLPTGADLTTATIPSFNYGGSVLIHVDFSPTISVVSAAI